MNKITLDERLENAVDAFFETQPDRSNFALTYTGETALAPDQMPFTEKADKWLGIAREILMFGPGAFSLFYLTLTIAFFYPTLGFSFQGGLMYFFAIFLTYAGSGSITKIKNLAIPATIIALAMALVFSSSLFGLNDLAVLYFWYSIYLFPIVLIAAKLVQGWVSDK